MNFNSVFSFFIVLLLFTSSLSGQTIVGFEDVGTSLESESFYNGSDGAGGFSSGNLSFNNTFTSSEFGDSWFGWSYSNRTDTTTPGFGNQYSSFFGSGDTDSPTFAVAFNGFAGSEPEIQSNDGRIIESLSITNTTYAALSMRDGDSFAKKFGGESGDDPDFFKIDILSLDENGNELDSIEFFLADFRFADNAQDFIVNDWTSVDVSTLSASRLGFRFSGSDVGEFGLNTPAYFAVDNIVVTVPEPSSTILTCIVGAFFIRRNRNSRKASAQLLAGGRIV